MIEIWKTGFEPIDLDQKLVFWNDICYESDKFMVSTMFQAQIQTLFGYDEQRFYSLMHTSGEIILGIDHYYDKKSNVLYIRYTYRCPDDLDGESTEWWIKALFKSYFIDDIKKYYRRNGYANPKVKWFRFTYLPVKEKKVYKIVGCPEKISLNQTFTLDTEEYVCINTWPVFRAYPENVIADELKEEIRYYAMHLPFCDQLYIGVKSIYKSESRYVTIEFTLDRYAYKTDKSLQDQNIKKLINHWVVPDLRKYYQKKGIEVEEVITRFRKPLSFDPGELNN